jgi:hypothetical protein
MSTRNYTKDENPALLRDILDTHPSVKVEAPAGQALVQETALRIPCPHCKTGGINVSVAAQSIDDQIRSLSGPRRCDMPQCAKFFSVNIKISVTGVPLRS